MPASLGMWWIPGPGTAGRPSSGWKHESHSGGPNQKWGWTSKERYGVTCGSLPSFSSTAESFGVSAQIGSGVVRGSPEVRFHQGSTRVPPRLPGFHQGSTRVPPGFHQGSTRVPPGFHDVLRGLRVVRAQKRARHAVGDIT